MQFFQGAVTDAVKMMWYATGFNCLVAMMNLGFCINHIISSNWISAAAAGVLTVLNATVAWFLYTRLEQHKAKEKQRVVDILSGRYDTDTDTFWQ